MPEKIRILYVDDERSLRDVGKKFLEQSGDFTVFTAESAREALALVKEQHIDAVISDYQMPTMNGIDLLKAVRNTDPDLPFIFFSGKGTKEIVIEAFRHGADLYLQKRGDPKFLFEDLQHTITEIVTLRNTEQALHESEKRYRSLFEGVPIGLYRTTPSGQILDINPALVHLLGYPNREMLMTVSVPDLYVNPGDRNQWLARIEREGIVRDFEVQFRTYDGTIIWVRDTGEAVRDDSGQVLYYNGNIEDITERKRAEAAIVESFATFKTVMDGLDAMVYVADMKTYEILFINQYGRKIWGDLTGKICWESLQMDQKGPCPFCTNEKLLDLDSNPTGILIWEFKNTITGQWYDCHDSAIRWTDGRIVRLEIATDITERKRAEEALAESEEKIRLLLNSTAEAIYGLDMNGNCTFCNSASLHLLGYKHPDELLGRNMHWQIHAKHPDGTHFPVEECRIFQAFHKGEGTHVDDEVFWRSDGTSFPAEYRSYPQRRNGAVVGTVVTFLDITRQKETETQLENYKETLEQRVRDRTSELSETNLKLKKEIEDRKKIQKKLTVSSNEKDLLLREVHHRVKNNLQLIIGLVDMTKTRAHDPSVISTLTDIMTKVQTMGSIHTRLYESKRFDKINMKQQIHDLVDMISGFYDHDHLDITTTIDCADIYLPVDQAIPCALALNEIISNLHKHAFKGRRSGLVEISSSVNGDQLRFVIRDNGVGLPSGFDIEKSNRLGFKLMRTLVEQQLHGSVTITGKAGTEVVIEFPINWGE